MPQDMLVPITECKSQTLHFSRSPSEVQPRLRTGTWGPAQVCGLAGKFCSRGDLRAESTLSHEDLRVLPECRDLDSRGPGRAAEASEGKGCHWWMKRKEFENRFLSPAFSVNQGTGVK